MIISDDNKKEKKVELIEKSADLTPKSVEFDKSFENNIRPKTLAHPQKMFLL